MKRVKIVIISMVAAIFAACTAKPDPTLWVTVTVNSTADSSVMDIGKIYGNQRVKIVGTLNELDFWMLRACNTLTYLDLSDVTVVGNITISPQIGDTPDISQIGNAIPAGAFGKATFYYPEFDTTFVFTSHPSLRSIVLPQSVTKIGKYAFQECKLNHPIEIPNSVTQIYDSAFTNCGYLNGTLTLPNDLKYLGSYAFDQCGSLTGELIIPQSLDSISAGAFSNCIDLSKITIHERIRKIGFSAFAGTTITQLDLPDQLLEIDSGAFRNCRKLTGSLDLPKNLTFIGSRAFEYAGYNETLVIPSTVRTLGRSAFDSTKFTRIELYWDTPSAIPAWDTSKHWFPARFETENFTHQYLIIVPQSALDIYKSHFAFQGKSFYNFEPRQ